MNFKKFYQYTSSVRVDFWINIQNS